jgi:hypothetical protein
MVHGILFRYGRRIAIAQVLHLKVMSEKVERQSLPVTCLMKIFVRRLREDQESETDSYELLFDST